MRMWSIQTFLRAANVLACTALLAAGAANAAVEAPNALIARTANEVLNLIKSDPQLVAGDVNRLQAVVDERVMPYVDFERMTCMAQRDSLAKRPVGVRV
jgi:phospholipid transport system substrate-binding protein